jgi:hypothetical protein
MRVSEEQLAEILSRTGVRGEAARPSVGAPPFKLPRNEAGALALGRLPAGQMNKTEAAYDAHLRARQHDGDVLWHKFEGIKLRLANNTFLTVDFPVLTKSLVLEMHEVKGFMQDDANVKLKVAASIYPFVFKLVRKGKAGIWDIREVTA